MNIMTGLKTPRYPRYSSNPPHDPVLNYYTVRALIQRNFFIYHDNEVNIQDIVFYEDKDYFYFVNKKKTPFLSRLPLYVKAAGGRIRKSDGFMLLKGLQTWIPMNYIPFSNIEAYETMRKWKTTEEVERHIGAGYAKCYYYLYNTNNVLFGVMQQREYLSNQHAYSTSFINGVIVSHDGSNFFIDQTTLDENGLDELPFVEIPDWYEGVPNWYRGGPLPFSRKEDEFSTLTNANENAQE